MGSTEKHSDEVPGFSFQLTYPGLEIGEVRKPEISRRTDQKSIQNPAPSIKMTRTREAKRDRKLLDSNTLLQPNTTGKHCGPTPTFARKGQQPRLPLLLDCSQVPNLPPVVVSKKSQAVRILPPTGSNVKERQKNTLFSQPTPWKGCLCFLPLGSIKLSPLNKSSF